MSVRYDAVVVGAGLAGMMAALELRAMRVALVSYGALGESTSSAWAQGGIAAAVGGDDSPALHAADTVAAGAGLVDTRVAARLAADGPPAIERMAALGVRFDRDAGERYALGREAAHSRRRILKAGGDATGAELVRALVRAVRASRTVTCIEGARALDVRLAGGAVTGLVVRDRAGRVVGLETSAVVLATGGIGGLYRFTTNPTSSCGSGIALAARAGARLADLEFVQFHPTALDVASDPLPLVTEALRGEGAVLLDERGRRLMAGLDPALELAPRDVVARGVFAVSRRGGRAFLDARAAVGAAFPAKFPTVYAACRRFGIDPRVEPIPVVAAAHYHMGGVAVDLEGRTNVPGLYACGEVAAGGVHGANRLASNSLLESVVYPERIARDIARRAAAVRAGAVSADGLAVPAVRAAAVSADGEAVTAGGEAVTVGGAAVTAGRTGSGDLAAYAATAAAAPSDFDAIRDAMYRDVGVLRDGPGLERAVARLGEIAAAAANADVRDAALVGGLIARAARERRETRGSHARLDYPASATDQRHRSFTTLAAPGRERKSA